MRTVMLVPIAVLACRESAPPSPPANAKPSASACPLPSAPGVVERFAVGVQPTHRVSALYGEAPRCIDTFEKNAVFDGSKLVAEGSFFGHCPDQIDRRTFEAVQPAHVIISVDGTHVGLGELGANIPALLSADHPEWLVAISAQLADRCGTGLSSGYTRVETKWTPAESCSGVIKLVPFDLQPPPAGAIQIAPIAAGACTISAEQLGVTGSIAVTVRAH